MQGSRFFNLAFLLRTSTKPPTIGTEVRPCCASVALDNQEHREVREQTGSCRERFQRSKMRQHAVRALLDPLEAHHGVVCPLPHVVADGQKGLCRSRGHDITRVGFAGEVGT